MLCDDDVLFCFKFQTLKEYQWWVKIYSKVPSKVPIVTRTISEERSGSKNNIIIRIIYT